ncbi:uncharacterized protein LOC130797993 isoform X2 [Amaranthus tricolor]|uniref:uncharacterized protein LOC130797993 isoform X2 n=1 Tax=Amaranthus tricolor TaxID=29722 RepID=UPI0025828987|nr:uncharacterized protein LOC130797993 isoform X2 [Amaranthus tricolor]
MASREGECLVDIEYGGTTSEEEGKTSIRAQGGVASYNGLTTNVTEMDLRDSLLKPSDIGGRGVDLPIEKRLGGEEVRDLAVLLEKKNPNEHRKKVGLKNASKPPRPPNGPLLFPSDLKLVKEFSELAARKRARIERIKAFRKMKEAKRPASGSSITALVITVLFFLIIVFQGVFSGNSLARKFQGSPAAAAANEGLISIHVFNNAPTYAMNQPISLSPDSSEMASGSIPLVQDGRDAG